LLAGPDVHGIRHSAPAVGFLDPHVLGLEGSALGDDGEHGAADEAIGVEGVDRDALPSWHRVNLRFQLVPLVGDPLEGSLGRGGEADGWRRGRMLSGHAGPPFRVVVSRPGWALTTPCRAASSYRLGGWDYRLVGLSSTKDAPSGRTRATVMG